MKWLSVFILSVFMCFQFIATDVADEKIEGAIDDLINTTINSYLKDLDDPLTINTTFERFNNAILTGWLNISEFQLVGLKSIVAAAIDVEYEILSPSILNITFEIGGLNLYLDYETSLLLGELLPFSGKGNISANLDTLTVSLYSLVDLVLVPYSLKGFENTTIAVSVGDNTWVHVEGVYYNDAITKEINDILDAFVPRVVEFIDINQERISNVLSAFVEDLLNDLVNSTEISLGKIT